MLQLTLHYSMNSFIAPSTVECVCTQPDGTDDAELDDNRMHPARSAPRCLPCNYTDPLQPDVTQNAFQAPQVAF